jgi:3-carboxy-cis,cis-muconate cycloisomerase
VPGQLAALFSCFDHSHERATGAWHGEWQSLREMFVTVGGMLEQLDVALDGIAVHVAAMSANLDRTQGLVMAEAVAMALSPALGRSAAQALVKRAVAEAASGGRSLHEVLGADETLVQQLGRDGLARVMAPAAYLGVSATFIDTVLARYEQWRGNAQWP